MATFTKMWRIPSTDLLRSIWMQLWIQCAPSAVKILEKMRLPKKSRLAAKQTTTTMPMSRKNGMRATKSIVKRCANKRKSKTNRNVFETKNYERNEKSNAKRRMKSEPEEKRSMTNDGPSVSACVMNNVLLMSSEIVSEMKGGAVEMTGIVIAVGIVIVAGPETVIVIVIVFVIVRRHIDQIGEDPHAVETRKQTDQILPRSQHQVQRRRWTRNHSRRLLCRCF